MNNDFYAEVSMDISRLHILTKEFSAEVVDTIGKIRLSINPLITTLKLLKEAFDETFNYSIDGEQMSKLVAQSGLATDKFQTLAKIVQKYGGSALETAKGVEILRKGLADIQKGGDGNGLKDVSLKYNLDYEVKLFIKRLFTITNKGNSFYGYCFYWC